MKEKLLRYLKAGILSDQSGQDAIEFVILAAMILGLAGIILNVLTPLMANKTNTIQTIWPQHSP